ncbi:GNAT family N-acetyltransferase [Bacillus pseudomycoides]|uniref:GNAT family N-acetyltransferase n=2 Tax=Bacillus pseudomycoides TaxID=64104 RepID=UPI000BED805C|nr:GNAT family N-acetyltransferase [Bacillus pseudomycoides]PED07625.1 GNAT family N-acetyltransferase [Bacillus pseudomycoides]PEI91724.1 GNAT family N-acetyltransferase [Bacillus pseudomycoides]PEK30145.1 GNAT family N-acetyltransferase [Bacillus pseudomycoides]PEM68529.1 GNAT family N-acetyltransferase [Bacillus pseudomycoides]PEO04503.1 GNAT family N-acetyltransferase [Bacillus pseudomycoides]
MLITIQKAVISDAEKLTEIMKKTFDAEARRWLLNQKILDYNIQPPGYSSVEMTKYMIEELVYYKIINNKDIVGGIIVTITGKSFGRIDRIFIDPDYQGEKIGSRVIELIEEKFPTVRTWDLETSSRQVNNHHFYEKMGYRTTFKTEDEYCYIKRKESSLVIENLVENKDISNTQYENCNMEQTECYQVNLEGSSFSNSNIMNTHFSNCNLSHSKFQNINFKHSLYADLNLSHSKMRLVTLGGVRFINTNLGDDKEPLSFERCDLQGTKISNSNLRNLQIMNSDITGMTIDNIPVEKLLEVYYQELKK